MTPVPSSQTESLRDTTISSFQPSPTELASLEPHSRSRRDHNDPHFSDEETEVRATK